MATQHKNSINHKSLNIVIAKNALANFLKQNVDNICCEILTGGSDEKNIVKCTYQATSYVIKFFNISELSNNEIKWTKLASDLVLDLSYILLILMKII